MAEVTEYAKDAMAKREDMIIYVSKKVMEIKEGTNRKENVGNDRYIINDKEFHLTLKDGQKFSVDLSRTNGSRNYYLLSQLSYLKLIRVVYFMSLNSF